MITFANGISIGNNPTITKTNLGVRITNDLGLEIELSDIMWQSLTKNKKIKWQKNQNQQAVHLRTSY